MPRTSLDTLVLDLDGTLVDTVYQHTDAWIRAFDSVDVVVPAWRIHRAIGMGSDRLVAAVAGDAVEAEHGDAIREGHDALFEKVLDEVHPLPGAAALIDELHRRGVKLTLATSGVREQAERLLALVGAEHHVEAITTTADAEHSKPAGDVITVAVERVGGTNAAIVGDAVWDVRAASDADCFSIAVLTGGFSEGELHDAGADRVYDDVQAVVDALDDLPFSAG